MVVQPPPGDFASWDDALAAMKEALDLGEKVAGDTVDGVEVFDLHLRDARYAVDGKQSVDCDFAARFLLGLAARRILVARGFADAE